MNVLAEVMPVLLAFVAGWLGAAWLLKHAEKFGLIRMPDARSSHVMPTPTGGGMGMVLGVVCAGLFYAWTAKNNALLAAVLIALWLAMLGWWDDRKNLSPLLRLVFQVLAVAAMFTAIQPLPVLLPGGLWLSGVALLIVGGLAAVWWLNLYNFMDGIDGLAASQAVFMMMAGCALSLWTNGLQIDLTIWLTMLATASTALGFLMLNWTPARIFMGDTGSLFLACMTLYGVLATVSAGWLSWPVWIILSAAFWVDASVTLMRRLLRRQRVQDAHRTHAYQNLAQMLGAHDRVTLRYMMVNLFWLLPMAVLCIAWAQWVWLITACAIAPLIAGALGLGAGKSQHA